MSGGNAGREPGAGDAPPHESAEGRRVVGGDESERGPLADDRPGVTAGRVPAGVEPEAGIQGAGETEPSTTPTGEPPRHEEREAFWTYSDLFLVVGLAFPAVLSSAVVVRGLSLIFRNRPPLGVEEALAQGLFYAFMALVFAVIFRVQYERPIARSLGWKRFRAPSAAVIGAGIAMVFVGNLLGILLRAPRVPTPMTELMEHRASLIVLTVFGVTIAPAAEELGFRGFLQPLLMRTLPAWAAILATATPFGLLHLRQYGYHWQYAVVVCAAGAAFGVMRHITGSTKASALMHAAFNGVQFAALWAARHGS